MKEKSVHNKKEREMDFLCFPPYEQRIKFVKNPNTSESDKRKKKMSRKWKKRANENADAMHSKWTWCIKSELISNQPKERPKEAKKKVDSNKIGTKS